MRFAKIPTLYLFTLIAFATLAGISRAESESVRVGSKNFTEGYLLGELLAQRLEKVGQRPVERSFGLGGSGIVFRALLAGEIDVYPEYTGTIAEELLRKPEVRDWQELTRALAERGLVMSKPLGFHNSYALAIREDFAETHKLRTISDLRQVQEFVRTGFSHEFKERNDGLRALLTHYQINFTYPAQGFEHSLAYTAIAQGRVDLIDVYTTDARLGRARLRLLRDDRNFFPEYAAVILAKREFTEREPELWRALEELSGTLKEEQIRHWNYAVEVEGKTWAAALANVEQNKNRSPRLALNSDAKFSWFELLLRTREHLVLVFAAFASALLIGIPSGILAAHRPKLGRAITLVSGIIQTIPSLALLCFLIPFFGIGAKPAIIALSCYGLLPVVLSTMTGLVGVNPEYRELGRALGMKPSQLLWRVELPLATRNILSGLKTSIVISIGTATLAALIGAGGLGVPILAGLAVNDLERVFWGAVPAAALAFVAEIAFAGLARFLVPKGLRA